MVNDMITEVNGKDTGMNAFGSLLPADKTVPLKMRLIRMVEDTGEKKPKKPKAAPPAEEGEAASSTPAEEAAPAAPEPVAEPAPEPVPAAE